MGAVEGARSPGGERRPDGASSGRSQSHREPAEGWADLSGEVPPLRLPETPFGRFAFAHAICAAGDTLVTIALAGSLFFSVGLDAARLQVLKYLVISLTPFVVLSPFIGPLIDRFSSGRRWIVVGSATLRAVICLFMAGDLKGLLLFPEAFAILVLSKTYTVAKSSLVPGVVGHDDALVRANSRLSLIGGLAGFAIALPGGLVSKLLGSGGVLWMAALVFSIAALAATRIVTVRGESGPAPAVLPVTADSGAGAGAAPAKALGPGAVASTANRWRRSRAAQRQRERHAALSLRLASVAMATLRADVGFLTFLVAFTFRDDKVSKVWFGLALGASAGAALVAALLAPRLRMVVGEERIVAGSLGLVAVLSLLGVVKSSPAFTCVVAAATGAGAAAARLGFDSLVQRDGPADRHGETFARYETRFQLAWVLGALLSIVPMERFVGFLLMAVIGATTIVVYLKGEPALERISIAWQRMVARRPSDPLADPFVDD